MDDMKAEKYLKGKRILIVDDEEDILETLSELLIGCRLDRATRFEDARALLENRYYDIVVLDIMGVNGHDLLEPAVKRGFPTVMLTAHALTEEDLQKIISWRRILLHTERSDYGYPCLFEGCIKSH